MEVEEIQDDIHATIRAAMNPSEDEGDEKPLDEPKLPEKLDDKDEEAKEARERDEKGKFKAKPKEEVKEQPIETIAEPKPVIEPPLAWSKETKKSWAQLPPAVQAEIAKREEETHKMFTSNDGEYHLGKQMKEVISPYMPIIQAEGGTPVKAVQTLLNTAYQLRTAAPQQKAALVHQIIRDYGVDMNLLQTDEQADPTINALQQEIANLKQQLDPNNLQRQLQSYSESAKVNAEVEAFASDPVNVHYQQVKPIMAALLGNGQAANLKEAYDMACMAKPDIRSTLIAAQEAEKEAKRKSEIEAKKKAAVSISGSPSKSGSTVKSTNSSIEDDLREAFRAHSAAI